MAWKKLHPWLLALALAAPEALAAELRECAK